MKIVADENIPFAEELFSHLGDVQLTPGRTVSRADLADAEVLLVRSVTKVNAALLDNSAVKFVGTCTIGTDHLDKHYLARHDICFDSAPGCNANAVVQYVICALSHLGRLDTTQKVAIIGCGNVGGRLYRMLKSLGFNCVGIDPHLTTQDIPDLAKFDAIYDADIICMHTPRIQDGPFPTESLLNAAHFPKLKAGALLLNAGRGECINNDDLLTYLEKHHDLSVVLDVWHAEPDMNPRLFEKVSLGTPHIAGYSFEGRVNGSTMIFSSLAKFLGKNDAWIHQVLESIREKHFGPPERVNLASLGAVLQHSYDIGQDHDTLAESLNALPDVFDTLRKNYPKRREFTHYQVDKRALSSVQQAMLTTLGFL